MNKLILTILIIFTGMLLQGQDFYESSEMVFEYETIFAYIFGGGIIVYVVLFIATILLPIVVWYYLGQISRRLRQIRGLLEDIRQLNISNRG